MAQTCQNLAVIRVLSFDIYPMLLRYLMKEQIESGYLPIVAQGQHIYHKIYVESGSLYSNFASVVLT